LRKFLILALVIAVGLTYAANYAKYVIVCADALYNSILPLAEWKQATGLPTRVVKLSQIVGSDTTALKAFVRDAYSSGPVQPEYLLLVGAGSMLPARLYYYQGQHYLYCSTDNVYADMGGTIEAEIPVGRFPATSAAQLDVMVAKTLKYERTPDLTDSLWMRKLTTIVREGGDEDDTLYWNNIRNAATKAAAAGFVNCDSLSYFRGHNSTSVMNSCNAGSGFVFYRGSAQGTWYTPFDQVRPGQLTSTNKLPIICSITCQTLSLAPYEVMLGDSWMRAGTLSNLRGGVAFFGNSHPAAEVARQRGAVARGFFNGLFDEGIYKLGKTVLRAKHELYTEFPTSTNDYRGFNLLGDPDLGIWTATPKPLTVEHPAEILPGSQQLRVVVGTDSQPVQGALVCASMDTVVYATGYTDSAGTVDLTVNPPDSGRIRLVVTGRNLYPYDAYVHVLSTAVAEPTPVRPAGAYGLTATPAVFTRTCHFTWNSALAGPTRLSIYDAQGRLAHRSFAISTSSLELDLTSLPAGFYLAVLRDHFGHSLGQTRVTKLN
jgi:hypothetical protein